jgi:telomere length regulation protein
MEELLAPVSTSYKVSRSASEDLLVEVKKPSATSSTSNLLPSTPEEALQALRSEPDFDTLRFTLKYLVQDAPSTSNFRINQISPIAAQLINTLCSEIVPNYWVVLNETSSNLGGKSLTHGTERKLLLSCLRSLSGLNATVGRIKTLLQHVREAKKEVGGPNPVELLRMQLDVLETLLRGEQVVAQLWDDLGADMQGRQRAIWHEVTALVAGGRILNVAAEATSVINDTTNEIIEPRWIAHGISYSRWLARNIIHWSKEIPANTEGLWKPLSEFLNKALRLGHPGIIICTLP